MHPLGKEIVSLDLVCILQDGSWLGSLWAQTDFHSVCTTALFSLEERGERIMKRCGKEGSWALSWHGRSIKKQKKKSVRNYFVLVLLLIGKNMSAFVISSAISFFNECKLTFLVSDGSVFFGISRRELQSESNLIFCSSWAIVLCAHWCNCPWLCNRFQCST